MRKDKGSWNGEAAVPAYRGTPLQEAARNLATQCRRYIADRANENDVENAIQVWRHLSPLPTPPVGETQ